MWRVCVLWLLPALGLADYTCNRVPYNVQTPKVPGDNGYKIKIGGNPERYVPGEVYTGELIPNVNVGVSWMQFKQIGLG